MSHTLAQHRAIIAATLRNTQRPTKLDGSLRGKQLHSISYKSCRTSTSCRCSSGQDGGEFTDDAKVQLREKLRTESSNQDEHEKRLDQFIDYLVDCQTQQDLVDQLGAAIHLVDQRFWLRIASRVDIAESQQDADLSKRLRELADTCMTVIDKSFKRTDQQLDDTHRILQEIMAAAADDKGEWHVPLSIEESLLMKKTMMAREDHLNEALLANVFRWIEKSKQDNVHGIPDILQKVLQLYASMKAPLKAPKTPAERVFNEMVEQDEREWRGTLRRRVRSGEVDADAWNVMIMKRLEWCALEMDKGTRSQSIVGQYLKGMDKKARDILQELREGRDDDDFDELDEGNKMEAIEYLETAAAANEGANWEKAKRQREVKERLQGVMSIRRGAQEVDFVEDDFDEGDITDVSEVYEAAKAKVEGESTLVDKAAADEKLHQQLRDLLKIK